MAGGTPVQPSKCPSIRDNYLEQLHPETKLYLALVYYDDAAGDVARIAVARRHARIGGVATECGMARGDPARLPSLLAAHVEAARAAAQM